LPTDEERGEQRRASGPLSLKPAEGAQEVQPLRQLVLVEGGNQDLVDGE
jgi:hypothetical protein